jgi:hypothetical protein
MHQQLNPIHPFPHSQPQPKNLTPKCFGAYIYSIGKIKHHIVDYMFCLPLHPTLGILVPLYIYMCVCDYATIYIYIRTSLQVSSTNLLICYWYIYHRCIPVLYPSPSMKSIWIVRFPYEPFTVLGPSAFLCNASAQDWQKDMRHLAARSLEDAWSCLEDGNVQQCQQDLGVQWSDDLMHLDHFGRTKNVRIIKDYQSNQIRKNLTQNAKWNHTSHHRNWKQRDFVSLMKRLEKNQRS